jgi:putative endonuclease
MSSQNKQTGAEGEQMAANYLQKDGWQILARNWTIGPWELDIIALKADVLAFVEVKTLSKSTGYYPERKANRQKFRAMAKAGDLYLSTHPHNGEVRFDVIAVILLPKPAEVVHFTDVWFPNNLGR